MLSEDSTPTLHQATSADGWGIRPTLSATMGSIQHFKIEADILHVKMQNCSIFARYLLLAARVRRVSPAACLNQYLVVATNCTEEGSARRILK
jgi:hypothetical protein